MVGTGETPLFAEADWSLQQDFLEPELQHCSVTEVRALAARLRELQTASQAEEASSVLSHYSAFVATAREISSLQADVSRASEALAGLAAVQQQLREPSLAAQPAQSAQLGGSLHLLLRPSEPASTTALHAFSELMELLEVQLAEGQLAEAQVTLEQATHGLAAAQHEQEEAGAEEGEAGALAAGLALQRDRLAGLLSEELAERATPAARRRAAAQGLVGLGQASRAYALLLEYHGGVLSAALRPLRPPRREDEQGMLVFAAEVSQAVCDSLARAVRDVGAAFPAEPARASSLLAWVQLGVSRWARIMLDDGAPCAEGSPLVGMAAAARICLLHAQLLEPFGLAVAPQLAKLLRTRFSGALEAALSDGEPSPQLITAAEAYLRGGSSAQLWDVATRITT